MIDPFTDHADLAAHLPTPSTLTHAIAPCVSGCIAFGSTLALSTFVQLKFLNVSTGTMPIPTPAAIGLLSVALASLASHSVAIKSHNLCKQDFQFNKVNKREFEKVGSVLAEFRQGAADNLVRVREKMDANSLTDRNMMAHTLRICCVGFVTFKLLGGRFWAVAPSSYTNLGSFARGSLKATMDYATKTERQKN
mmetsp:Transcript_12061/g.17469  ORF Transcript_12061/g.17469 Transcript_12061/m.17469 type:complete len:194 (+) Transcript_12061:228-809(+)